MKLGDTIPSTADGKTQAPGDLSCSPTQTGAQAWPLPGCPGRSLGCGWRRRGLLEPLGARGCLCFLAVPTRPQTTAAAAREVAGRVCSQSTRRGALVAAGRRRNKGDGTKASCASLTPRSEETKNHPHQDGVTSHLQRILSSRKEAMFELVTSEASYYKSLSLLVSHFVENERLKKLLHPSEAHILFSNVLDVMGVSERFLLELERRMEENIVISDVCDIVYRYAANHFSVYITYVSNQTYQERTYKQLLQEKAAFRELIAQLELDPKCRGLPLSSFLILPFQRITRLKLLVQNILKRVEESSEREATALDAHKELELVVKACNEGVRKMSRTEQMISIQKKMEFKIKSVPIISHSRWLLKQGELQQMSGPKTSRTLRTKKLFREIYLFLFNDLLVICRQIPGDKYQVFDSAPRGLLRVEELEDQGQTLANVFILRLLENADDREATYMLKATSQSEMKRWMTSLAPNRRTKFVSFTSRLLDCPQVQCVHPYVAQQPDELTLELADILNILDKTEDGWIFGERLHDQERGWFPSNMTEEILNPKIRSQNLKECFRVHKMDDPQRSQNKDRRKLGSRNRQ
uniref:Ephexin-1 n=1 Tax=Sus scrofa TaxID=9823 RepID=A0A8D0R3X3_PIG